MNTRRYDDLNAPSPIPRPAPETADKLLAGRYRVVKELGRGGSGLVYLCEDARSGVRFAVKALPDEYAQAASEMGGVLQNFKLVQNLHHPHIAALKTLEHDQALRRYYVVQEYAPGKSLRTLLREADGRIPPERALAIARQTAEALDYAHGQGVVHRDIKPDNLAVGDQDNVKVLDFGIAGEIRDALTRQAGGVPVAKPISGTVDYMPPEQWTGAKAVPASDQFALAITLCQMLSGDRPFHGDDDKDTADRIMHKEPRRPEGIPDAAWRTLRRALSKSPSARFPSCRAFVEAFADAWFPRVTPRILLRRRVFVAVTAALVLIALGFGLWFARRPPGASSGAESGGGMGVPARRLALLIGVEHYGAGWAPVTGAVTRVQALARTLGEKYGYQTRLLLDREATRSEMVRALDEVLHAPGATQVLVYHAGHTHASRSGESAYWIPSDARPPADSAAPEQSWLSQSVVSGLLNASPVRHVLLVSESDFAGVQDDAGAQRYAGRPEEDFARAHAEPSRRILAGTSPAFPGLFLRWLREPPRARFGLADFAHEVKPAGKGAAGPSRLGWLSSGPHGQGEYLWCASPRDWTVLDPEGEAGSTASHVMRGPPSGHELRDWQQWAGLGATATVSRVLSSTRSDAADDWTRLLLRRLAAFCDAAGNQARRAETDRVTQDLHRLVREASAREASEAPATLARPRVLAFMPIAPPPGEGVDTVTANFYVSALQAAFSRQNGFLVVEREQMEAILSEHGLRLSALADPQARFSLGKILPASLIFAAQLVPTNKGLILDARLIDTASTRHLAHFQTEPHAIDEWRAALEPLVAEFAGKARASAPITAEAKIVGERVRAGIGDFQRVRAGTRFAVRPAPRRDAAFADDAPSLGVVRLVRLGPEESDFGWEGTPTSDPLTGTGWILREEAD